MSQIAAARLKEDLLETVEAGTESYRSFDESVASTELEAAGETVWGQLRISWACDEVHGMIILWMCPPIFQKRQRADQLASCAIRSNPFYWFVFIPTVMMLVSGRLFHSFFGQGGPIRTPEHPFEHEARVHWILVADGCLFPCIVLDIMKIFFYLGVGKFDQHWKELLVGIVVLTFYLIGNVMFIRAMTLKKHMTVQLAILANLFFFIALLIAYIFGIIYNIKHGDVTAWTYFEYVLRFGFIVCTFLSWYIYCKLFNFYKEDAVKAGYECDCCSIKGVRMIFFVLYGLFMLFTVFVLFANPIWADLFWKALV